MISPASTDPQLVFRTACDEMDAGIADCRRLMELLLELTWTALSLPDAEPDSTEVVGDPPGLNEAVLAVNASVSALVGDRDFYWELFDPRTLDQPVGGSLADDVSDIYRDLRQGLHHADSGHPQDALWDWRFSFRTHWGNHATDAIRTLHRLLAD